MKKLNEEEKKLLLSLHAQTQEPTEQADAERLVEIPVSLLNKLLQMSAAFSLQELQIPMPIPEGTPPPTAQQSSRIPMPLRLPTGIPVKPQPSDGSADAFKTQDVDEPLTKDELNVSQADLQNQGQAISFMRRLTRLFGRRKLSRFLSELEVFQNLSERAINQIARQVEEIEFTAGTPIIRQGEVGDCMYILAKGEITIPVLDKKTHRQFEIKMGPGQIFGEMALLTGERRFADVTALTDCSCLLLYKHAVENLIRKNIEIAQLLTSILGKRLMQTGEIQHVGHYKLLGQLGEGGIAFVYEAVHEQTDQIVALKMLSHQLLYQEDFAERFRQEAKILSSLRHPHIVDFIALQEAYATFFIIMEKLAIHDLSELLQRDGPCSFAKTQEILLQVARALAYAHDHGIVHRDIKPSNIMFTEEGTVKVGDFGLSLQVQEESEDEEEAPEKLIVGTPVYMAPEQILRQPVDGRTDIYALGVVAYEILTGEAPFLGQHLQEILYAHLNDSIADKLREKIPTIPAILEEFVQKATAKKPEDRFQDAHQVLLHFGAEPESAVRPKHGVQTLTFVYPAALTQKVQQIVSSCVQSANQYPDIQLHASDRKHVTPPPPSVKHEHT